MHVYIDWANPFAFVNDERQVRASTDRQPYIYICIICHPISGEHPR